MLEPIIEQPEVELEDDTTPAGDQACHQVTSDPSGAKGLPEDPALAGLRQVFNTYDMDGNGTLSRQELKPAFESILGKLQLEVWGFHTMPGQGDVIC